MDLKRPANLQAIEGGEANSRPLLCLHGLNQRPEALQHLLRDLCHFDLKPYLMSLPGHDGRKEYYDRLNPQVYWNAYKEAYGYLANRHKKKPYFLGYSFGGLIGVRYFESCSFEKMILLAPALKLRPYALMLQPFLPFISRVTSLSLGNSQYEKKYRFHEKGVPKGIYQSFFSIYSQFHSKDKTYLEKSNALVFCHPKDELISHGQLRSWVKKNTQWHFQSIDNKDAIFKKFNHLCFDPITLGFSSYDAMLFQMGDYFSAAKGSYDVDVG